MVTLTVLLARRRLATRLVIAVRPGEQFGAHAWLVHEHALTGARSSVHLL